MTSVTRQNLIDQLRADEPTAIKELYQNCFKICAQFVLNNGGSLEDARDNFQEALYRFIKQIRKPDFELKRDVNSYLLTINRNLWIKQRQKKQHLNVEDIDFQYAEPANVEEKMVQQEEVQDLRQKIMQLPHSCRQIIILSFYDELKDAKIAELMKYSLQFIRQKRRRCIRYLRQVYS